MEMHSAESRGALVAFSFESSMIAGLPLAAQRRLAERASLFNARMQLTGELLLSQGRFSATIEGRPEIVLPLAGRIIADRRHEAIRVHFFGQRDVRSFTEWTAHGFGDIGVPLEAPAVCNVRVLTRRDPAPFSQAKRIGNPVLTGLS